MYICIHVAMYIYDIVYMHAWSILALHMHGTAVHVDMEADYNDFILVKVGSESI